jgi:hypothetical protein
MSAFRRRCGRDRPRGIEKASASVGAEGRGLRARGLRPSVRPEIPETDGPPCPCRAGLVFEPAGLTAPPTPMSGDAARWNSWFVSIDETRDSRTVWNEIRSDPSMARFRRRTSEISRLGSDNPHPLHARARRGDQPPSAHGWQPTRLSTSRIVGLSWSPQAEEESDTPKDGKRMPRDESPVLRLGTRPGPDVILRLDIR